MKRFGLKSKIHRAVVTKVDVDYEGSLSLDEDLLKAADLLPHERVEVYNVSNGERFSTYLIREEKGSREVGVFGAAGHRAKTGDRLIIASYAVFHGNELESHRPKVVLVDEENAIKDIR